MSTETWTYVIEHILDANVNDTTLYANAFIFNYDNLEDAIGQNNLYGDGLDFTYTPAPEVLIGALYARVQNDTEVALNQTEIFPTNPLTSFPALWSRVEPLLSGNITNSANDWFLSGEPE